MGSATTVQPSGSNSRCATAAPPRHGSTGTVISSGMAESASSWREAQRPLRAVLNTSASATPSSEDAAYDRSLTYWPRLKSGRPRARERARRTGSTSSSRATVQRSAVATG